MKPINLANKNKDNVGLIWMLIETMEFFLIKDKSKLVGTAYFELLPGKFNNKHWNDVSIFFSENTMSIIEDLFEKNIISYGHYSFCEAQRDELEKLISDLEIRVIDLIDGRIELICGTIFSDEYYHGLISIINKQKDNVISTIIDLINWIRITLIKNETISILGL